MNILGRVLTILLGAVPATYLSSLAALGIVVGVMAMMDGEIGAVVLVVWGGAGIYGTLSLWAVGIGPLRRWAVVGLVVGAVAMLPLTLMTISKLGSLSPDDWEAVITIGPIVVAIAWLGVLAVRSFFRPMFRRFEHVER